MSATHPTAIPTDEELIAQAATIIPTLRENADTTEQDRRVADDSIRALRSAGLARMATEKRFGGYETDLLTQLLVLVELGKGCPSTGWVEAILLAGREMIKSLDDEAKQEVFGDNPDAHMFTSNSPTGMITKTTDGYVVDGKWGFCSGSDHAEWGFLMCLAKDEAGNPAGMAMAVVPKDELIKHDVWHVAGMCGTGSNTWEARNVLVPEHRATLSALPRQGSTTAMSLTLLAVVLGAARGAQELVVNQLGSGRAVTYSKVLDAADSPIVQVWLAEAAALFDRAETELPTRGISGFRSSHLQALEAERIARSFAGTEVSVFDFEDLELFGLLSLRPAALAAFVERELGALARRAPSEQLLRETLICYLENDRSLSAVASRLHIAKNTVLHRVRRASSSEAEPFRRINCGCSSRCMSARFSTPWE